MANSTDIRALKERLGQVRTDLAELEQQEFERDIELSAVERIRAVYEAEIATIMSQITSAGEDPWSIELDDEIVDTTAGGSGWSRRSWIATFIAVTLGVVVIVAIVRAGSDDAANPQPTADQTTSAPKGESDIDTTGLSDADLEDLLAQRPDLPAVQLALADRYLAEGESRTALDHYVLAADSASATPLERSRALARIGYLAYKVGEYGPARRYLTESLGLNDDNLEAKLYLGYVLFDGFDDPDGAAPYLEAVLADPSLPAKIADDVRAKLAEMAGS